MSKKVSIMVATRSQTSLSDLRGAGAAVLPSRPCVRCSCRMMGVSLHAQRTRGPLSAVSPRCAPRLWGLTLQKWVVLLGPHTVFVPQQQRPGAALPEAPGPGPVSFLLTEGGCEQSQEQGECDGVAANSLCADWDCVAEDTTGTHKARPQGWGAPVWVPFQKILPEFL